MSSSPKAGDKRELSLQPPTDDVLDKKPRLHDPPATTDQASAAVISLPNNGPTNPKPKPSTSNKKPVLSKRQKKKQLYIEPCSHDDVYWQEVIGLIGQDNVDAAVDASLERESPFGFKEEVEVSISRLSSNGEGLALTERNGRPWVLVIPFCLPGEKVRARVYRQARLHSFADFLELVTPNEEMRDMSRVRCKYFGRCAGCQYQMLSYEKQLELKRDVVVRAYTTFSDLPPQQIPTILPTIPSPLQYGYRTKITPHFDDPTRFKKRAAKNKASGEGSTIVDINIGFNQVGKKEVMDIEECPIATPVINEALRPMRENINKNIHTYKKGVSLLLRDSLEIPKATASDTDSLASTAPHPATESEKHICVTDHRGKVRERVGDMLFEYVAGSFFQNNNSVLPPLVNYVRDAIFPPSSQLSPPSTPDSSSVRKPTHLVDAYCGSGLFSIMLSPYFQEVSGIELSQESIACAIKNAKLNRLNASAPKCAFRSGDAFNIFDTVSSFPAERTAVIIDPPRKGCDEKFIEQLLKFRSEVIVYVSCNVHTQARDVGWILKGGPPGERNDAVEVAEGNEGATKVNGDEGVMDIDGSVDRKEREERMGRKYQLLSIRGVDLFPQTAHVESVAVLRLV